MPSSFIHVIACPRISFPLKPISRIYPSMDDGWFTFHSVATVNSDAVLLGVQRPQVPVPTLCRRFAGYHGNTLQNFMRGLYSVPHNCCTIVHSHPQYGFCIAPTLASFCSLQTVAIVTSIKSQLTAILKLFILFLPFLFFWDRLTVISLIFISQVLGCSSWNIFRCKYKSLMDAGQGGKCL